MRQSPVVVMVMNVGLHLIESYISWLLYQACYLACEEESLISLKSTLLKYSTAFVANWTEKRRRDAFYMEEIAAGSATQNLLLKLNKLGPGKFPVNSVRYGSHSQHDTSVIRRADAMARFDPCYSYSSAVHISSFHRPPRKSTINTLARTLDTLLQSIYEILL